MDLTDDTLEALNEQASLMDDPKKPDANDTDAPEPEAPESKPDEDIDLNIPDDSDEPADKDKTLQDKLKVAGLADVQKILKDHKGLVPEAVIKAAKDKLDADTVDMYVDKVQAEYKASQYAELEKAQAESTKKTAEMNKYIYEAVGGADKFKSMADVLKVSMDKETLGSINAKLLSGNKLLVNEALKTAVTEYKKIKGIGGVRMEGDAAAPTEKELVVTREEYRAIMKTEKYKTDPLYQRKVDDARLKTKSADQKRYGPGMYYGMNQNGRYEL